MFKSSPKGQEPLPSEGSIILWDVTLKPDPNENDLCLFDCFRNLFISHGNNEISLGQYAQLNVKDTKLQNSSLSLTGTICQGITVEFQATRNLLSIQFVTAEYLFKEQVMSIVGNTTNKMTFINTYLPHRVIQAKGNGTIETQSGQTID